jgi:hypothetical protein
MAFNIRLNTRHCNVVLYDRSGKGPAKQDNDRKYNRSIGFSHFLAFDNENNAEHRNTDKKPP